ncbi:MAG: recombinase family protein [Planctomycetota bacterium]
MKRPLVQRPATALIYTRVSSRRQVDGTSLARQDRETVDYCARLGIEVLETFADEGASAKSTDRPEFQKMLQRAKQLRGKVGYVVVYSTNRFARSGRDHHAIRGELMDLGIVLRSVTEPVDETPAGRLNEAVLAGYAEFDNSLRAERSADGMFDRAIQGRWVWKCPIGFLNVPRSSGGPSLAHDPQRAPLIRMAFEMFATGEHSKAGVLAHVTALGLVKRKGRPLTPQDFSKLLEKPVYAGRVVSPGWKIDVKGDFEPIVSEDTFDRVQALLCGKRPESRRHVLNNPQFPLRRFVYCAWCSKPLTASNSKGRSKPYPYYRCRNNDCDGDGDRSGIGNIPPDLLESQFLDVLRGLTPTGKVGGLFREVVRDVCNRRNSDEATNRRKLTARIGEVASKERQLTEAFATRGAIDKDAYADLLAQYRTESAVAREELRRFESEDLDLERALDLGERLLNDAARLWTELDSDRRGRLQRFLFPDGIPYDGERFGTAATCGVFSLAGGVVGKEERMVTPRGFEPLSPG